MKIGEKIKLLREKHQMTQQDLADKLNITFQSVSKWENNLSYPSLDLLLQISKLYGVSLNYLIDENQEELKDEESCENKEVKLTIKVKENVESLISVFPDNNPRYKAFYDQTRNRTYENNAIKASSNKKDFVMAVNKDGKIIYLAQSTGYGYGSPCDYYYHPKNITSTSEMECFYLLRNYAPYGDGTKRYENFEFVIPRGGLIITISTGTIEFNNLFNFLNKENGVKTNFAIGELDDFKVEYENELLTISYIKSVKEIVKEFSDSNIIAPIVEKYIDEKAIVDKVISILKENIKSFIPHMDYNFEGDYEDRLCDLECMMEDIECMIGEMEDKIGSIEEFEKWASRMKKNN